MLYALQLDFAAFAGGAVFVACGGFACLGGCPMMGGQGFDFAAALQWQGKPLSWVLREIVNSAASRYQQRQVYDFMATMAEIAYSEGNTLLAEQFNKWRKVLDAPCSQNCLFTVVLVKTLKGGKCYDKRLLKTSVASCAH